MAKCVLGLSDQSVSTGMCFLSIMKGNDNRMQLNSQTCWYLTYVACTLFLFVDMFVTEMWTTLEGLEDPELKRLAAYLLATVLRCKATSTTKKYAGTYHSWREWASKHKLPVFSANKGM